jgi:hypothetical protein
MTPCVIDWSLVVGVLQFLAIAVTGGGAVWVAGRQLSRFNDNERTRNTVEVLRDADKVHHSRWGDVSVEEAIASVVDLSRDDGNLRRFKAIGAKAMGGRLAGETGDNRTFYKTQRAHAIIVNNYFVLVADLLFRGLLDKDLTLNQLSTNVWEAYDAVAALEDPMLDLQLFRRLADEARTYDAKRPKPDSTPPSR